MIEFLTSFESLNEHLKKFSIRIKIGSHCSRLIKYLESQGALAWFLNVNNAKNTVNKNGQLMSLSAYKDMTFQKN